MAQIDKAGPNVTTFGVEDGKINIVHVAAGGSTSLFGCLALDITNSSTGAITTYYYWPMSDGHLRYGSTAPTAATQDSAGAEVNH